MSTSPAVPLPLVVDRTADPAPAGTTPSARRGGRLVARLRRSTIDDAGMATAEYAVATVAACGFGGILYKLLSSDFASSLLMSLIKRAFSLFL